MAKKDRTIPETTDAEAELADLRELRKQQCAAKSEWDNHREAAKEAKALFESLDNQIKSRLGDEKMLWDGAESDG